MIGITRSTIEQPKTHLTLLDLARAAAKDAWAAGETSWIWGDKIHGAFLSEVNGFVRLFIVGKKPGLNIYMLSGPEWTWNEVADLDAKYADWKEKINKVQVQPDQPYYIRRLQMDNKRSA